MIDGYKDSPLGKIPKNWEVVKLEEVCIPKQGMRRGPFGGAIKKEFFVEKGFQVYEQRNAIYDDFASARYFINEEKYRELSAFQIQANDFIISCSGTIGKIAQVPENYSKGVINQALLRIRLDRNKMRDDYFLQQFRDAPFQNKITDSTQGGAMKNLVGMSEFRKTLVTLPPLPEQQKIAEILSTVDDKIEVIDQQIIETQALKKGLMQRLLTKGIGHTEFKDSPLGMIPKRWEVVKFGDTLSKSPEYGANASAKQYHSTSYRYIRITDILENGKLTTSNYVGISKEEGQQYELIENDILIARTGNTVGKSYHYFNEDGLCSFAGYLIRFRCDEKRLNPKFISQFLHSDIFWNWVKSIVRTGAQPNINSKEYQSMLIPLPNILEQQKIAEVLSSVDDKLEVLSEKKTHYQELKQGLMQQLLTGKIRVTL